MFLLMTQIYFQIHCLKSDVEQMVILLSLLQDTCKKKIHLREICKLLSVEHVTGHKKKAVMTPLLNQT